MIVIDDPKDRACWSIPIHGINWFGSPFAGEFGIRLEEDDPGAVALPLHRSPSPDVRLGVTRDGALERKRPVIEGHEDAFGPPTRLDLNLAERPVALGVGGLDLARLQSRPRSQGR